VHVEGVGFPRRDDVGHPTKGLLRGSTASGKSNPGKYTVDMDVHRKDISTKREQENARGRFHPDSIKAAE